MRNISFSATTEQVRTRRKYVTRRGNKNGPAWKNLKPGDHLMAVEKCQGLKKGEHVKNICEIEILDVTFEPVDEIARNPLRVINPICLQPIWWSNETTMEGFPEMTPQNFVEMFCEMNGCTPITEITRILFDYV
jgi:hypothetical protein